MTEAETYREFGRAVADIQAALAPVPVDHTWCIAAAIGFTAAIWLVVSVMCARSYARK